jgi:hypothetical protein
LDVIEDDVITRGVTENGPAAYQEAGEDARRATFIE